MPYGIRDNTNDTPGGCWLSRSKYWAGRPSAMSYDSQAAAAVDLAKIREETSRQHYAWLDRVTIEPLPDIVDNDDRRRVIADGLFATTDFGWQVKDADGWEHLPRQRIQCEQRIVDVMQRTIYFEPEDGGSHSVLGKLVVQFFPDKTEIFDLFLIDPCGERINRDQLLCSVVWTVEDTHATYKHGGWSIFYTDDRTYALQKLDDPDSAWYDAHNDNPPGEYNGQRFDTDAEAAAFVQKSADEGDSLCRKAIEFLIAEDSESVKEFQLRRTW